MIITNFILRLLRAMIKRNSFDRQLIIVFICTISLIVFGTAGFMIISKYSFVDALLMVVTTLTTVGYGEINPLDVYGRIFAIILIVLGVGVIAYSISYSMQILMDGTLLETYRRMRMKKQLDQISNHYILCGYGQMGQIIADDLRENGKQVIVIENSETFLPKLREKGIPHIIGDASEEENLLYAGIQRAAGLIAVVSSDPDNVFIVLTAHDMNANLKILARAHTIGSEKKLIKAGASWIVSPYASGSRRIVRNILKPTVHDFWESANGGLEISIEELKVPENSVVIGTDVLSLKLRTRFNIMLMAVKRCNGKMVFNPASTDSFCIGDILVIIGSQENLTEFTNWVNGVDLHSKVPVEYVTEV